ncbi:hypothetical protein KA517_02560 [Candidatus Gracilibacteria bacterium]|jgi:hypothetical protein|nr:hypothetical protein [Candidatus Gracilibacteria bacterium]MBP7057378.1 hypothetical protein [Candidatus Gracilibacteria bacterium]
MSRKPIVYYKITRSGPKSSKKPENALKSRDRLLKRLAVEGKTKWLLNALAFNMLKLKKYGLEGKVKA